MGFLNSIFDGLKRGYKNVMNSRFMNSVFDRARKITDVAGKGVRTKYDGIRTAKDFATNIPVIGSMIKPYGGLIDIASGIVDGITGGLNSAKNLLSNVQRGDFSGAEDSYNGIKNEINTTSSKIDDIGIKNRNLLR
jgi:hypothetical protein